MIGLDMKILRTMLVWLALGFGIGGVAAAAPASEGMLQTAKAAVLAKAPLYFEPATGERGVEPLFLARGCNYQFSIKPDSAQISLSKLVTLEPASPPLRREMREGSSLSVRNLRLEFLNANPEVKLQAEGRMAGKINYFLGRPQEWRTAVPTFQRVRAARIYPGIDLVYYGNQERLEFDFALDPEAEPDLIAMRYSGADGVSIEPDGELLLDLGGDKIRQHKPIAYQVKNGARVPVSAQYRLLDRATVGFEIGEHERTLPLVIDPILSYSSYFGGDLGDIALSVKVREVGTNFFVYVAGETLSTEFPYSLPAAGFQTNFGGGTVNGDAFVAKFNHSASNLEPGLFHIPWGQRE